MENEYIKMLDLQFGLCGTVTLTRESDLSYITKHKVANIWVSPVAAGLPIACDTSLDAYQIQYLVPTVFLHLK